MIAYKNTCATGIEAGCAMDFEFHSEQAQNISKENTLRPIIFSWVDEYCEKSQKNAYHSEMKSADSPQKERSSREICFSHTIASKAPGRISSERHSRFRISPSIIKFTGPARRNSTRLAPAREARGCSMCFPVNKSGKFFSKLKRPTGAQRTYSISPSVASAFG